MVNHHVVAVGSPGEFGRAGEQHGETAPPFFTPMLVLERQHKEKVRHSFQAKHAYASRTL